MTNCDGIESKSLTTRRSRIAEIANDPLLAAASDGEIPFTLALALSEHDDPKSIAHAASLIGTRAELVTIEAHPHHHGLQLDGIAEPSARETRVRVQTALEHNRLPWPRSARVFIHPVEQRRGTAGLDLAIAIALHASVTPTPQLGTTLVAGELDLNGSVRPVRGIVPILRAALTRELRSAIIPITQLAEASLVHGIKPYGAATLTDAIDHLHDRTRLPSAPTIQPQRAEPPLPPRVHGYDAAKLAMQGPAARRCSVLLIGPAGTPKILLARELASLMTPATSDEALEIATIHSAAGLPVTTAVPRPFRAPHHTASKIALLGGGSPARPGEVTLAHGGVLLLDEITEFRRSTVEDVIRATRCGTVTVHDNTKSVTMPAGAVVIATMAPCPCGHQAHKCTCTSAQTDAHIARAPLHLFDVHIPLA